MIMRIDGRNDHELREISVVRDIIPNADASVLIRWGNTHVICTVSLDEKIVPFRLGTGLGWLTAEYAMLPASTGARKAREFNKRDGRSVEIQRLIGRSLRSVMDFEALGERTVWIDCDVINADGGTRTASITGGYIALAIAAKQWMEKGLVSRNPVKEGIAAVSCGIVDGRPVLDLNYQEDSHAEVDCNFVITESGRITEIQGTGEQDTFTKDQLLGMLDLAEAGIGELSRIQKEIIGESL